MNLPQVYMCSPPWTLLSPPSPYHPSGSSQCTSPKHPVSCIEPGLATRFIHDILHVSILSKGNIAGRDTFYTAFPLWDLAFNLVVYKVLSGLLLVVLPFWHKKYNTARLWNSLRRHQSFWFCLTPASAKSLQSCLTLSDPIDGSPPGFPVPGILQARTMEWVGISFSSAWKWKVKVKSLSHAQLLATAWTAAYQAPPPMGFSRQEYWSGVPLPSPA